MQFKNIILEQNPHWYLKNKQITLINRDLISKIKLKSNFIEVISGVRRSGKSSIFKILIHRLITKSSVNPKKILFLNFDHPAFIHLYDKVEDLDRIIDEAKIITECDIDYLFLDEVQNINFWEKWAKTKYDLNIFKKIFITGSNSKLLEGQYISRLSGRYFSYINSTFSFKEYLTMNNQEYYSNDLQNFKIKNKLASHCKKYLKLGGFPEVVKTKDKEILNNYYQTILLKDVIDNNEIRDSFNLKQLAYFLISNTTSFFSYNRIAQNLGMHEGTVKEYIEYLKAAYLFYELRKYDPSLYKQNINKKKIYCADNGLVNKIGFSFSANNGKFLENLVFIELNRIGYECFYHEKKYECDFVIKEQNKIKKAIQVCYNLNPQNRTRELNGLKEALETYKLKQGLIITDNQDEIIIENGYKIVVMSAWRWLLTNH